MPRSKRFTDMSRSMSHQQSSSPTHEQLLNDAPLEEQTQDNETPQEQAQDSETRQDQNESSSKKKTRTAWEVDVINEEGFVRKKKLKVKEVWTLPLGEKIIVPFDNFDTPSTDAAGLFTGTLAGLAQESSTFPINFTDWRLMPKQYKEDTFAKIIKLKFHFQNDELAATKAQLQVQSDKLQVQSDMQKAMGGALVAILERTFGKVPEEFATFLNQTSQPVPDDGSKQQSSQGSGKKNSSSSHHVNGQSST